MNIYEIDNAMFSLIDEETGEIKDYEAFEELQMQKEEKIENTALWYKNLVAESKAIREEEKALAERRKSLENKAENLKNFINRTLDGNKFSTSKVAISYRKSTAVEVDDEFIDYALKNNNDLLTFKRPEPNKTVIKGMLQGGFDIPHAELVERNNMSIK
ncbi:MAG: siphovirus Gp157 family protein [Hominilimicola sp.]